MVKTTITQGVFYTNTYLWEYNNYLSIIDIGDKDTLTLLKIKELGLPLKCTILTHNHLDHIRGLSKELFEKPVYMHRYDLENLSESYLDYSFNMYGYSLFKNENEFEQFKKFILLNKNKIVSLEEGDIVEGLKVLLTKGHTKGSICLVNDDEKLIFTGDTIFRSGYGRTDLKTGNYEELLSSINKLKPYLENGYKIYPGH